MTIPFRCFRSRVASAVLLALLATPVAAQQTPELPPVDELVQGRQTAARPKLDAELAKVGFAPGRRLGRHLMKHIVISGSYGHGLTVLDDLNGHTVLDRDLETRATWSISYKASLSALAGGSERRLTRLDREIAEARYRQALLDEEIAMRKLYNSFLEARAGYRHVLSRTAGAAASEPPEHEPGFEMRRLALELLLRAGQEDSSAFTKWSRYRPTADTPTSRIAKN